MMTLIQVFDALSERRVSRIDFKDGSYVVCPSPMVVAVEPSDTPSEASIEVCDDGLVLHFNANRISPRVQCGMQGQVEPLSNVIAVR